MARRGRRYHTTSIAPRSIAILALSLISWSRLGFAASAVLGIDVGTEYIKAALVKPGIPLEIVLTKDSKRKETSAIAFKPIDFGSEDAGFPERLYGGDALALAARFPADVYPNLKPLLGLTPERISTAEQYQQRHPALDLVVGEQDGMRGFRSKSFGTGDGLFSVEELLGMELQSVKESAEIMAGKGHAIRDAVISIPAFYTADEKRAIELAAELAGLRVMGLVSDGLAVGLNYAIPRTFPNVEQGEKPEHHLIFDMGAGSTTATILKFQARTVKDVGRLNKTIQEISVLGNGWDRTLGGDALNEVIVDDMINQFVETKAAKAQGIQSSSVKTHGRTAAKLRKEAERSRQVLSANSITSASFEGLYEDIDFRYKLSRSDFENLAGSYSDRVSKPITDALLAADLSISDLDSVVLHGGLVRTPFIQKCLEELLGDPAKLKSNVNADEAAVFGAAFKAAGLSPSFRVKDIKSSDAAGYSATLIWTSDGKERQQKLFIPTSQVGTVKQMPFKNLDDFSLSVSQQIPQDSASQIIDRPIALVKVANLTASVAVLTQTYGCDRATINTTLSLRLDPFNGLPEVTHGTVSCEVDVSGKKGGVVENMKGLFGFGSKETIEPLDVDGNGDEASPAESVGEQSKTSSSSKGKASTTAATETKPDAKPKAPKRKTQIINLNLVTERVGLPQPSQMELRRIKDRLAAFDKSDKGRRLRDELFNVLEGLTYRTRDMISDRGVQEVTTADQRNEIEKLLSATSAWLSESGPSADLGAVKEKLQDLRELVDPVQNRKMEVTKRPEAVRKLRAALDQSQAMISGMKDQIEKASAAVSAASEAAQSSSASEAAQSSSASEASQSSSATTSTPSDDLDELEDKPTPTPFPSAEPLPYIPASPYTDADLAELSSLVQSHTSWLSEQLAVQKALSPSDDPLLLSTDIEAKERQLNSLVAEMLMRATRTPPRPRTTIKPKSSKAKKRAKTTSTFHAEAPPTAAPGTDDASATETDDASATETDDASAIETDDASTTEMPDASSTGTKDIETPVFATRSKENGHNEL